MKKEELFNLLGGIDDKFYEEAMEDELQEPAEIVITEEESTRLFPHTLFTAAAGIAITAGICLTAARLYGGANNPLNDDIRYCRDYISDFYPNVTENADELSYRVLDLNFDGVDEILLTDQNHSLVYIFGTQGGKPEFINMIGENVHDPFMGTLDGLYPYENGEEKYYYYFFSFDKGADMEARGAAAIRFDGENEKYRQSYLLSYGIISNEGSPVPYVKFFREGWHIQDNNPEMFTDIGEETFTALWNEYEHLPPISFDDFKNNNSTKTPTEKDLIVCLKYIANYNNSFTGEVTYKYYDLNFDGVEEIVFAPNRSRNQIFIFEQTESEPRFVSCIAEEEIGLDPTDQFLNHFGLYEKLDDLGENIIERYYYFYYDTYASDGTIKAKAAAAIKYDGEKYYTENLLSYGVLDYGDSTQPSSPPSEVCFFRDDFNTEEIRVDGDYSTLEYEEFKKRWDTYQKLPPIDFSDISVYCTSYEEICPFVYEDTVYEYNYDYWNCVIKDGTVTSMRGETRWDIYDERTGKHLESAAAMREFKDLEYLGEWVGEENMWFNKDSEMYRYKDKILVLSNPDWEDMMEWDINTVEADLSEYYKATMFEPCKGHYKYYEPFDLEQVPDIQGSSKSSTLKINGLNLTDTDIANYTAMYRSFSKVKLYTEKIGGYTFDLMAEKVRTDKAANPDMIYCSDLYMTVSEDGDFVGSNISATIPVELSDIHALPTDRFSDYMPQIYELKDGIVIFTSYKDVNGLCSPFITIKNDLLYPMYGDFSPLIDKDELYPYIYEFHSDIKFTPDFEENILYYGDTAFKFNFDKVGIEEETELFTVIEP